MHVHPPTRHLVLSLGVVGRPSLWLVLWGAHDWAWPLGAPNLRLCWLSALSTELSVFCGCGSSLLVAFFCCGVFEVSPLPSAPTRSPAEFRTFSGTAALGHRCSYGRPFFPRGLRCRSVDHTDAPLNRSWAVAREFSGLMLGAVSGSESKCCPPLHAALWFIDFNSSCNPWSLVVVSLALQPGTSPSATGLARVFSSVAAPSRQRWLG